MQGRTGWVLLLLAAVFTMHGLQCAADDSGSPSAAHGTVHTIAASGPAASALHLVEPGSAIAATGSLPAPPLAATLTAATSGVSSGAGHDSSPHGSGHLWALCLAVLAAGLAASLPALAGRLPETSLPLAGRVTTNPWAWLSPLRPPDLHSLCLLRI